MKRAFPSTHTRRFDIKKSITLGAAALPMAGAAQAEDLFVNIHSGNAMAQGAGLVLAGHALKQPANVRVLQCDTAADITLPGKDMPKLKPGMHTLGF